MKKIYFLLLAVLIGLTANAATRVYWDNNSVNLGTPYIYIHDGQNPPSNDYQWPGVQMSQVEGISHLYYYDIPHDAKYNKVIFHNNNKTQFPSDDGYNVENGAVYKNGGKKDYGNLYIIGSIKDHIWQPGGNVKLTPNSDANYIYEIKDLELVYNDGVVLFRFGDTNDNNWGTHRTGKRYVAQTDNTLITPNASNSYTIDEFTGNGENERNWKLAEAGKYNIQFNFETKKLIVTKAESAIPQHMYMYYSSNGNWDLANNKIEATPSGKIFTWTKDFADSDYLTFSTNNTSQWNDDNNNVGINSARYCPSSDIDVKNGTETSVSLSTNQKSFKITEAGKYTIKMDFNTSPITVTFTKEVQVQEKLKTPSIKADVAQLNKVDGKYSYYLVTIDKVDTHEGVRTYYTTNGTDPTAESNLYTEGRKIQVPSGHTVRAINIAEGYTNSDIQPLSVGNTSNMAYSWETADPLDRLYYMRINIERHFTGNQMLLASDVTRTDETNISYGTSDVSEYSWAKYFNKPESDALYNSNPSFFKNSDHIGDTPQSVVDAYTKDVQHNDQDYHIARNFTDAHYRVYVHSDFPPASARSLMANKRAKYISGIDDEIPETSVWNSNKGTAAGNINPLAETRVAYTTFVSTNQTTGIEDIVVPDTDVDPDAPVYYYNLQGVRVNNPEHGIYIRVQGKTSTKVYVK